MEVNKIVEEIKQLQSRLTYLEKCLEEIQQACDHHYVGNQHYQTCTKCQKVNVLYY